MCLDILRDISIIIFSISEKINLVRVLIDIRREIWKKAPIISTRTIVRQKNLPLIFLEKEIPEIFHSNPSILFSFIYSN